jgi:hypothetical protein
MSDETLYRQARFDRTHTACVCCGDVVHINTVDNNGLCEPCAANEVEANEVTPASNGITPTTPNFENSDIAFLMRD